MLSKPYDIRTTVSLCFGIYVNRQLIGCLLHCRIRHESWSEMQTFSWRSQCTRKSTFFREKSWTVNSDGYFLKFLYWYMQLPSPSFQGKSLDLLVLLSPAENSCPRDPHMPKGILTKIVMKIQNHQFQSQYPMEKVCVAFHSDFISISVLNTFSICRQFLHNLITTQVGYMGKVSQNISNEYEGWYEIYDNICLFICLLLVLFIFLLRISTNLFTMSC